MKYDEEVYRYLRAVPHGCVVTYGQIAEHLGDKKLARAVGNIIHANPDPIGTPCYKVVNRDGRLAVMYGDGGIEVQKRRLEADGIEVVGYQTNLKKYQWKDKP